MQYRYAYNEQKTVVDVMALPERAERRSQRFTCLSCEQRLIAKTAGKYREKHFAHYTATRTCSTETYLHRLAKYTFYNRFNECLVNQTPFWILLTETQHCERPYAVYFDPPCTGRTRTHPYNLAILFNQVSLEVQDLATGLVPDVLLTHSAYPKRKVYIEIKVHHAATSEKIAAGVPIIEIPVASENDIQPLQDARLTENHARFYHFRTTWTATSCRCEAEPCTAFIVAADGSAWFNHVTPPQFQAHLDGTPSPRFACLIKERGRRALDYHDMVFRAHQAKVVVRDCVCCIHAPPSSVAKAQVRCDYYHTSFATQRAQTCSKFVSRHAPATGQDLHNPSPSEKEQPYRVRVRYGTYGWQEKPIWFETLASAAAYAEAQQTAGITQAEIYLRHTGICVKTITFGGSESQGLAC